MPQSLAQVYLHTIFSTKDRFAFLRDSDVRTEMHAFLAGTVKTLGCKAVKIGGTADHVHLLTTFSRTVSIAEFVKETKRVSTNWIQQRGDPWTKFHWQAGYGVFSVSKSHVDEVSRYIENQEEHHRRMTFQDEFRRFLEKYEVEYDERYVWD